MIKVINSNLKEALGYVACNAGSGKAKLEIGLGEIAPGKPSSKVAEASYLCSNVPGVAQVTSKFRCDSANIKEHFSTTVDASAVNIFTAMLSDASEIEFGVEGGLLVAGSSDSRITVPVEEGITGNVSLAEFAKRVTQKGVMLQLDVEKLKEAISAPMSVADPANKERAFLRNVTLRINVENGNKAVSFVGSDGYSIAITHLGAVLKLGEEVADKKEFYYALSVEALTIIKNLLMKAPKNLENVLLSFEGQNACLMFGHTSAIFRLPEGALSDKQFAAFETMANKQGTVSVVVDADEMKSKIGVLKMASLDDKPLIKFTITKKDDSVSFMIETGTSFVNVALVESNMSDGEFVESFSAYKFEDVLKMLHGNAVLNFNSELSPVSMCSGSISEQGDDRFLVLPVVSNTEK